MNGGNNGMFLLSETFLRAGRWGVVRLVEQEAEGAEQPGGWKLGLMNP